MGKTDEMLFDFLGKVKSVLKCDCIKYSNSENKPIKNVAVCGGSGCDFLFEAKKSGADVFVTADAKYHNYQTAENSGIVLVDAGHFETENIICNVIKEMLEKQFDDLEILISKRKNSYIKYG